MNEKIKQLATQAGFKTDWQHQDVQAIKMARFEKFAELIAQECIKMVEAEAAQYSEPTWAVELVNDIAEQFGVTDS